MRWRSHACMFLMLTGAGLSAQKTTLPAELCHQVPDQDGIYYAGPEVSAPRLVRRMPAQVSSSVNGKSSLGMTAMAMVVESDGVPDHIQLLHSHGDEFDRAAVTAVKRSTFAPGMLHGMPVPVWIDVRVVYNKEPSEWVPEVLITERDLSLPDQLQLEDKRGNPLKYTEPVPIHTVDADFPSPFTRHPYVQVAIVTVLVSEDGSPREVRVRRGLGFGLDKKAEAAVWRYRFFPATKNGKPIAAIKDVAVSFSTF